MNLENNKSDLAASVTRGILGAVPWVGPAISELITNVIPNQRIERIARFIEILESKVKNLEEEQFKTRIAEPGSVDLMEDAFFQAARALTDERIEYIASLVKNGLTQEKLERIQLKKILWLLGELNDIEILLLHSFDSVYEQSYDPSDKHRQAIQGPMVHMGSSPEELAQAAIHGSYKERLCSLGLVDYNQRSVISRKRNEVLTGSDFDNETGRLKGGYFQVSPLGRLLLEYIDLRRG